MATPEKFLELARKALRNGNAEFALRYYTEAVEGGLIDAMVELGSLYRNGTGIARDYGKAFDLILRAANLGDANAMNILGVIFSNGEGVKVSAEKSFEWCLRAAEAGNLSGMYNTSQKYRVGDGVEKNIEASGDWLKRAADSGYPPAMYDLGILYDRVGKFELAFKWILKAACEGHANAMNDAGYMYSNGKGVERNPLAGMAWYKLAAKRDHAVAIRNLAFHYGYGVNVEKDFAEAVDLYERAIILGDIEAINGLGDLYAANGNSGEAVKYYQNAANLGNTAAMVNLAYMYLLGNGVRANAKVAFNWLYRASFEGDNFAKANLGMIFSSHEGHGDNDDIAKIKALAQRFLTDAAESGEPLAMKWLAEFLVAKDELSDAERWFGKAVKNNVEGLPATFEEFKGNILNREKED